METRLELREAQLLEDDYALGACCYVFEYLFETPRLSLAILRGTTIECMLCEHSIVMNKKEKLSCDEKRITGQLFYRKENPASIG